MSELMQRIPDKLSVSTALAKLCLTGMLKTFKSILRYHLWARGSVDLCRGQLQEDFVAMPGLPAH